MASPSPARWGRDTTWFSFDPTAGEVLDVDYVRVQDIEYAHEPMQEAEILIDEFSYD